MRLNEIFPLIPEGKFAVVGRHANSAMGNDPENGYFIEGPCEEDNFYESFSEARAVAFARFQHPQNNDDEFFSSYWVFDRQGHRLCTAYAKRRKQT